MFKRMNLISWGIWCLFIIRVWCVPEIRTHGTGFYQFSKDSDVREEQMETLNKLREQVRTIEI